MENYTFEVTRRDENGSAACRRYRHEGKLPSVVYAHGADTIPILLPYMQFCQIAQKSTSSQIFELKSSDPLLNGKSALVKEIQRHPLSGEVVHVDFQALRDDEEITVRVQLTITGEAKGVKLDGGILTVTQHDLGVSCLPRLIPGKIIVDISDLGIGDNIHASDIKLPEGVKLDDDGETTLVSVVVAKVVEEAKPAAGEAAVAGAEGAPAAGAAGAATAAAPAAAGDKAAGDKKAAAPDKKDAKK